MWWKKNTHTQFTSFIPSFSNCIFLFFLIFHDVVSNVCLGLGGFGTYSWAWDLIAPSKNLLLYIDLLHVLHSQHWSIWQQTKHTHFVFVFIFFFHLSQLSKGVNGSTFAQYDIMRNTPKQSIQQQLHSNQVFFHLYYSLYFMLYFFL